MIPLGDPERARRFVASISSAVAVNPALQECREDRPHRRPAGRKPEPLPPPSWASITWCPTTTRSGARWLSSRSAKWGYIQLAERSGQYLDLDAFPVVEGEYRAGDRFTRRPILEFLEDDGERENRPWLVTTHTSS